MIRIVASRITDIRAIEALLKQHGREYKVDARSMGSAQERERFAAMKAQHQWSSLPMVFVDDQFLGGEPELRVHLQATNDQQPTLPRLLGVGGLIPFVALAVADIAGIMPGNINARFALLAYAATILSFVGAVHWGMAVNDSDSRTTAGLFAASVLPALVAWVALLLPGTAGLWLFIVGFPAWYVWERTQVWYLYPRWYRGLRTLLTSIVTLALLATAVLGQQ
ncbi:MAG: DUF3429 family protein [Pseudomonadota bacterium]